MRGKVMVLYDFIGKKNNELSITKGEIITIIGDVTPQGWVKAKNKFGIQGFIPDKFFKKMTNNDNDNDTDGAKQTGFSIVSTSSNDNPNTSNNNSTKARLNKLRNDINGLDDTTQKLIMYIVGFVCVFGLLMIIILVPSSIRSVQFDEYAIKYTRITRKVDDTQVYKEGKYVFAPSTKLFRYSKIVEKLEIKIPCLTNNGIVMNLEVDIQYQIPETEVFKIFYTFGDPEIYEDFVELVASDAIRDVCGDYTAEQFYLNRTQIQRNIEGTISSAFNVSDTNLNIPVITLRRYSFPNVLDNAIKDKRYAENDIEIALNERRGKLVEASSLLLQSEINAQQLLIQAQAEVDSILAEAYAEAAAITALWEERAQFYDNIRVSLNMTADDFVEQYLKALVLQTANNPVTSLKKILSTNIQPTMQPSLEPTMEPTNPV